MGRLDQLRTVLLEGEIDIRVGDYMKTVREGALIGEAALIEDRPRAANVVGKSTCRLAQIDPQRFDFLVQQHPYFARHVMKSLVDHLRYVIFSKSSGNAVRKDRHHNRAAIIIYDDAGNVIETHKHTGVVKEP